MKFISGFATATLLLATTISQSLVNAESDEASDVKVLTTGNFAESIKSGIIMVEFYAPWCGHCKALAPEYEKAATELKDTEVTIAKVDCTVEQEVCSEQGVQGYPTIKVFRDGNPSEYGKARKADAIVAYLKKQLLPAVSLLKEVDKFTEFTEKDKVVVVGFFKNEKSENYVAFNQVASKLRDDFLFGASFDESIFKNAEVTAPAVVLYKKFDEKKNIYPENLDKKLVKQDGAGVKFTEELMSKFISINSVPLVNDIGPENYGKYVESKLPLAFLFVSEKEQREKYGPVIEKAAKAHRGKINFVYIDAAQFGGHASNLNLKEEWPAFAIQDVVSQSKYPFDQANEMTDKALTNFIDEFAAGNLKPSIKSAPIPEDNSGPVKVVVADNFESLVLDKSKDVFVEFYAPWCGHCKRLAPIWEELGEKVGDASHIVIAKMDATENDIPPGQTFQIEGFPTIKLFKAETNEVVDYLGDRSIDAFVEFLQENSSAKFAVKESKPSSGGGEEEHDEL